MFILALNNEILPFDKALSTGVITTIQGMGIVFAVLIILALLINFISIVCRVLSGNSDNRISEDEMSGDAITNGTISKGELVVEGIEDEETVVAIMAITAHNTGSSLEELKFNSIKALD